MKKSITTAITLGLFTCLAGCAAGFGDEEDGDEQDVGTQYIHIMEFAGVDQLGWYDLVRKLNHEFDQVCGDTFCEGEYTNLTPLTFNCSVSSIRGSVRDCAWTFAASDTGVDAFNAAIGVDAPTYECHVDPATTAPKLIALLAGAEEAIHVPLPGLGVSLYDTLGECFDNPIGQTPITTAGSPTPTYVSADSYYSSFAGQQRWRDAEAALVDGFDQVCGDTFCSGDYGDLQAMELQCSITKSTGNVKRCVWVFAGSYSVISSAGLVDVTAGSFKCPVAVRGTISQLITTLTAADAPGRPDPINRPLPGVTTSAYDALLDCLP